MSFPTGYHRDAWEGIAAATPAGDLDRSGMRIDAEQASVPHLDVVAVDEDGDGVTVVELVWHPARSRSLEALDVHVYPYLAQLSYDDVLISRRILPPEVVYVVSTTSVRGHFGQMLTLVVGGPAIRNLVGPANT